MKKHERIARLIVEFLETQPQNCGTLTEIEKGICQLDSSISEGIQDLGASVRDCIQKYSSDSKKFKYVNLFYATEGLGGGIWGLSNNPIESFNLVESLEQEIEIIKKTSAIREVAIRLVQPEFRKKLIEKYDSICPLTEIKLDLMPAFLRASHIKPWSKSTDAERLDVNNGILLSVHLDSLFDRGLISFDKDGNLLCRNRIIQNLIENNFCIKQDKIETNKEMQKYLEWHRDNYGFNNNEVILFNSKESE